jgi:hypothetical protein
LPPAAPLTAVREWIPEKAEFTFDLMLDDVERVAAGGLLWLLSLGEGHHLKLGGGRPLGFGSVTLTCDDIALSDGPAIGDSLRSLARPRNLDANERNDLVAEFRAAVQQAYGDDFSDVAFIKAFLAASTGDVGSRVGKLPTHYPRMAAAADLKHPSFEWFAANEHPNGGGKRSLPPLGGDQGLLHSGSSRPIGVTGRAATRGPLRCRRTSGRPRDRL